MELLQIEIELKKRLDYPYNWGMKQNDIFDNLTNFIYHTEKFLDLQKNIKERFDKRVDYELLSNYAMNRWFNFWSAHAIEFIFCTLPNVKPAKNHKDKLVDFEIMGISFDHKTTVFPKKYNKTIEEAQKDPIDLIRWLYVNQSQQKRKHLKNRLFIVLQSHDGENWKLKAELFWLKELIKKYVADFNSNKLFRIDLDENNFVQADIIWGIK
ncbi:MAG: hypothetical protein NTX22_05585 [Ignavibacteriales bacterium]|nr:hypothetical protein [Ignavibacteriales bacterium]